MFILCSKNRIYSSNNKLPSNKEIYADFQKDIQFEKFFTNTFLAAGIFLAFDNFD